MPVTGRVALRPNRSLRAERAVSLACAALANRQIGFGRVRFALRPFPHRCVGKGANCAARGTGAFGRHHLRSSLRRKLSACAYPAAAFRRLAARRRHLPCRPAVMRILCVIILHDWFLPSGLALAAKDKISPRHGCTNALRLQLRGAVERPGGPRADDRDERAERTDATNPRGSAAGFRKRRARPKRKRMDAEAAGGEGNLAIAEPP